MSKLPVLAASPVTLDSSWKKSFVDATVSFGSHLLAAPWSEATLRARNLLLTVTVAVGIAVVHPWQSLEGVWRVVADTLGPAWFLLLLTTLLAYAIFAFYISSAADLERYRLTMVPLFDSYRNALETLNRARASTQASYSAAQDKRQEDLERLEAEQRSVEERYEAQIARVEEALSPDPGNVDADEEWLRLHRRRRQEVDAIRSKIERSGANLDAQIQALSGLKKDANSIDPVVGDLFKKTRSHRAWQANVERCGPLIVGGLLFLVATWQVIALGWTASHQN